jgi:Zn-finger nucleic acid-binding protein
MARILDCPHCATRMDVHPYYGPGTIVIDTCNNCDALWLDYGELGRVINAPGKDRGSAVLGIVQEKEREQRVAQSISDFADYQHMPKRQPAPQEGGGDSLLGMLRGFFS